MNAAPGLAWRPETAWLISQRADLALTEVVAENVLSRHPRKIDLPPALQSLRQMRPELPIIPHGISLSLGSAEGIDDAHVARLGALVDRLDAPLLSEHLAYVRAGGVEIGHLTAIPWTSEMLDIVIRNIERAQQALPVPLALENIAPLFSWPESDSSEASFLRRVVEATGVKLVLDVANLHASAVNGGVDPLTYLDELPLDAIAYVHVAGGRLCDGLYHDTHADPVVEDVLSLLGQLIARQPGVPVLLEHDDRFPPHGGIALELDRISAVLTHPPTKAEGTPRKKPKTLLMEPQPIAQRQHALATALTATQPAPAGFDESKVGRAARSLAAKHQREATRRAPKRARGLKAWLSR